MAMVTTTKQSGSAGVAGFELASAPTSNPSLVIASHGAPRSGKSHLACTAPETLGWIPLDRNSRPTVEKYVKEYGKKILLPTEDLIMMSRVEIEKMVKASPEQGVLECRRYLNKIKNLYFSLIENKRVKTIVIDTGTLLWEAVLFANYGRTTKIMPRDRGVANQEMRELINACDKHLIVVHQSSEIWENEKPTGEFKMAGFSHMNYCVNCCVENFKLTQRADIKRHAEPDEDGKYPPALFGMKVYDCQANPMLVKGDEGSTLYGEDCTFQMLAMRVFPDSEYEDWE